eukprot:TRINITY_DN115014_c0_g1_i1.p1 TRINITY_DN115014_c0_g1~~TRINITY_DN115014_c0_g1_i1.p1  ORF type:complete len:338 (-),score=20.91 TRINITY_DN115014_c0_g1_i1:123-1136(-)
MENLLPVIDVSSLSAPLSKETLNELSSKIRDACVNYGFFYVVGHGISEECIKNVRGAAKEFFDLPLDTKKTVPLKSGGFTRGYIAIGEESGSDRLEVKEAFSYGYNWDENKQPENPLQGPNSWPSTTILPPRWRGELNTYYTEMVRVSQLVARGLAIAMGHDQTYFDTFCEQGDTISLMRMFHYFPYNSLSKEHPQSGNQNRIGSSPHTDWGFLTLILQQDDVVGLQVCDNGTWKDIPPVAGSLIVNIGDYVSLMNNSFKSPLHRVVTGEQERTSFVFFYYPSYDAEIPKVDVDTGKDSAYSLLKNQNEGEGEQHVEVPAGSFGKFILHKWEQVQRK